MSPETANYDYSADSEVMTTEAGGNVLATVAKMAADQLAAQAAVEEAEAVLEQKKNVLRDIKTRRFPMLLMECGQKKMTSFIGYDVEIELKDIVRASIPEQNQPDAFAWLASTNNEGVIKQEVKIELGKGEVAEKIGQQIKEFCAQFTGVTVNSKKAVHPMTLAALIRELLAKGVNVPMDTLGAIVQQEVTVKPKKAK